jgi:hypothetical protein
LGLWVYRFIEFRTNPSFRRRRNLIIQAYISSFVIDMMERVAGAALRETLLRQNPHRRWLPGGQGFILQATSSA